MSDPRDRSARAGEAATGSDGSRAPERVTFVVSVVLLAGLLGGIAWLQATSGSERAGIDVVPRFSDAFERHGDWYLPVEITNSGDEATDMVRVDLVRPIEGEQPEVAEVELAFVAGGETEEGVVAFDERPTKDTIEVDVHGYTVP